MANLFFTAFVYINNIERIKMKTDEVFRYAYDAYTNRLNGQSKKSVKFLKKMYQEGVKNPCQSRYSMNKAYIEASAEYYENPKKSNIKGFINEIKTKGREMWEYMTNSEYRKAKKDFKKAYKELYPKTALTREFILNI